MTKSLEKSLRLQITLRHKATQKMILLVLQNPEGGHVTVGRERTGGVTAMVVSVQSSSGLSVSGPGWLRASLGALHDVHVFKLLSRSQPGKVFLLKQQLFSVLGSPPKQKTGLFVDPP